MSTPPVPGSPLRIAGKGLLAAAALAAGVIAGAVIERTLVRRDTEDLPPLVGEETTVTTVDGTVLHVVVDDPEQPDPAALTVVFAHGYALSLESWYFQRAGLRGEARLVLYDQRSHGRSAQAEFDSHHVDQLGRDLGDVIAAVAPTGPLLLVGHSMGGMTVMSLAQQQPDLFRDRVVGVALIATTATGLTGDVLGLPDAVARGVLRVAPALAAQLARRRRWVERSRWADTDLGLLLTRMYSFGSDVPAQAGRMVADMVSGTSIDVVADFLPALQEVDVRSGLSVMDRCEVLVIAGASDRLTPPALTDEIVRLLPQAEYVVLPDSGHMLTIERADQVNDLLRALIARVRRNLAAGVDS
jgi:pimeloyl-ACP methyl ester carboxylesterase